MKLLFILGAFIVIEITSFASLTKKKVENISFHDDLDKKSLIQAIDRQLQNFAGSEVPKKFRMFGNEELSQKKIEDSLETFKKLLEHNKSIEELGKTITEIFSIYEISDIKTKKPVTFTGFYHIELSGSLEKTDVYRYPIYKCPDNNLGKKFTRKEIDELGVLNGLGLEILWLKDPYERFDLHIQGSGKVLVENDTIMRLNFACSNDYQFKSVAKKTERSLLKNPRYIFFQETAEGPQGTNLTELTPKRSIATDKKIFPLGGIAFITFNKPVIKSDGSISHIPSSRFVIDQSAGNAISGPYRGDLYFGEGESAQKEARSLYDTQSKIYYLIKINNFK